MEDEKQDLEWGLFWARIFGAIGLLALGAFAEAAMASDSAPARWGGAGALAGGVAGFAFMLAKHRRGDEFDRTIDRVTSVQAGLFTIFLIMIQAAIAKMGWLEAEPLPVFSMPGYFILYKTLIAQYLRAALARGKDVSGLDSLRP